VQAIGVERDYRFSYLPSPEKQSKKSLKTYGHAMMAFYSLGDNNYSDSWAPPAIESSRHNDSMEIAPDDHSEAQGDPSPLLEIRQPLRVPRKPRRLHAQIEHESWLPPEKDTDMSKSTPEDSSSSSDSDDGWVPPTMTRLVVSKRRIDFAGSIIDPLKTNGADETAWVPGAIKRALSSETQDRVARLSESSKLDKATITAPSLARNLVVEEVMVQQDRTYTSRSIAMGNTNETTEVIVHGSKETNKTNAIAIAAICIMVLIIAGGTVAALFVLDVISF